jgi:UDP-N-acetylglucosamine 2-epimerase
VNTTRAFFTGHPRIHVTAPLPYEPFIRILSRAWLIVSDSAGVQEEAPTLGKPLLVLRRNTERHEALASGVARLVGGRPERLAEMLEEALRDSSWADHARDAENPFGRGDAGARIAEALARALGAVEAPEAVFPRGISA